MLANGNNANWCVTLYILRFNVNFENRVCCMLTLHFFASMHSSRKRPRDSRPGASVAPAVAVAPLSAPVLITAAGAPPLRFRGCAQFRQRLVLAALTGRRLRIDGIRDRDETPGLRDFEASFLRLIDKLTNGTRIEINETGTSLRFAPGVILGGSAEHDCGTARSMGWYIEGLLPLLPFAKRATTLSLTGVTNDDADMGVDYLRAIALPTLAAFGISDGLSLKLVRRGLPPGGGGAVTLTVPIVRELTAVSLVEEGLVRRVRGVSFCCRVGPAAANRAVDGARRPLTPLLPDVFIYTDAFKGVAAGASPGFGVTLVASTTSGVHYGGMRATAVCEGLSDAPAALVPSSRRGAAGEAPQLPEDVGESAAFRLLDSVSRGGCVDAPLQPLFLTLMALTPPDISRVRLGGPELPPPTVATLRLLRDVLGVTFKLAVESAQPEALAAAAAAEQAAAEAAARAALRPAAPDADVEDDGENGVTDISPANDGVDTTAGSRKKRDKAEAAAAAQPLTLAVPQARSAHTVLATCLGTGHRNYAKKVT